MDLLCNTEPIEDGESVKPENKGELDLIWLKIYHNSVNWHGSWKPLSRWMRPLIGSGMAIWRTRKTPFIPSRFKKRSLDSKLVLPHCHWKFYQMHKKVCIRETALFITAPKSMSFPCDPIRAKFHESLTGWVFRQSRPGSRPFLGCTFHGGIKIDKQMTIGVGSGWIPPFGDLFSPSFSCLLVYLIPSLIC